MKRFLIRSIVVSVAVFLIGGIIYNQVVPQHYDPVFPFIVVFFFLTTNIVHFYLLKIAGKDIPKFTARFMAMSSLKMLFYLVVGIGYVLIFDINVKAFLVNYLAVYVIFTFLEVSEISRVVKLKK